VYFYIWPSDEEGRVVELELNGFAAIYRTDAERRAYGATRAAAAGSEDGRTLRWLIEGEPGRPAVWQGRTERPLRIVKTRATAGGDFADVEVVHRDAAQILEVRLPPLPEADAALPADRARALFPGVWPDPARSRVLVEMDVER
jgi:hypothetical protein